MLKPQIYKQIVIINAGVDPRQKNKGEIIALSKTDGSLIWSQEIGIEASNCILIEDKVYIACDRRMIVLNAETGGCELNEPSGFTSGGRNETLWSDGKHLFMISPNEQAIRVFSKNGNTLLQELKIPRPYMPQEGKPLVYHSDQYYLPLMTGDYSLNGVVYGLLVLSRADDKNTANIDIERWPVQKNVKKIDGQDGGEKYSVSIAGQKIEDVIRYGEIALKEVASVKGTHIYSDDRRNLKFNGKILFSTNTDDLGQLAEEKVKEMASRVENWAQRTGVCAGDGKGEIRITVMPLHK
jgi:outer membrane protein assembly factor BamB